MKEILQNLEIDFENNNLEIQDIKYNINEKKIYIHILSDKILHFDLYKEFEEKFTKYLEVSKEFNIIYKYSPKTYEYEAQTLINYYHDIVNKDKTLSVILKKINIEVQKESNKITFDINSKFERISIEDKIPLLEQSLANVGFTNLKFDFHVIEQSEEYKEEMQSKIDKDEKELIKNVKQKKDSEKKVTNDKIFGEHVGKVLKIKDIVENEVKKVTFEGEVFDCELRDLKKSSLLTIMVRDDTSSIICKRFTGFNNLPPTASQLSKIQNKMRVLITGTKNYDKFISDEIIELEAITILETASEISTRLDTKENKRIELHAHSKMSTNNGVASIDEYLALAKHFGQKAFAITDHNGVEAFVDLERGAKKYGIKPIYGVESSIIDTPLVVRNPNSNNLQDETYTIFDLETTGLSANFNKIIEIGAVKIRKGEILDRFQCFIKIEGKLSNFTTSLTGITDDDLAHGLDLKKALELFKNFYKGTTLVAHNATFDYQFLLKNEKQILKQDIEEAVVDTLDLSRILNPENTYHTLKILTRKYGVQMDSSSHHRADYDSEKLAEMFIGMLRQIKEDFQEFITLEDLNKTSVNKGRGSHELIYVKNPRGMESLYELISIANTDDYLLEPRIRREKLDKKREDLIIVGSGCIKSKLVDYYLNKTLEEQKELIKYYDYIELNPKEQYNELIVSDTFESIEQVQDMHIDLVNIAQEVGTKVYVSSNAHFINPEDYKVKEILMAKDLRADKVKKDKETGEDIFPDINRFKKLLNEKEEKFKHQYMYSTNEMYESFSYLDNLDDLVVNNPKLLCDEIEHIQIVPDDLFTPVIDGVDEKLKNMVYEKARSIYSDSLPEIVEKRIEKEVNSITKYGFSVIYYISHKLVKHSLDNGYLVGSRGSVGSSIVATFMDITEINPLAPHYICPKCQYNEFFLEGEYASGFDLPHKKCPKCDETLLKEGQDIPFETFLGFEGDKVPDIDLNFSGDFQANAHDYVRSKDKLNDDELFDVDHAFRAGTIGTIAEKTAFAYTKNYFDLNNIPSRRSDVLNLSQKCVGIKRTTGQHPGGIIVVPNHLSIYKFTPIQFPANDKKQPWRTTHFDFHSIHDNLLKLDILGHDDPTMLKKLYDLTGINPKEIDVSDAGIMELFSSTKSINIDDPEYFSLGTLGIPEFGTSFVMEMLKDTKPKTFSELVQISGLSHGTDVWLGNAQELIRQKICTLKEVIGCRDDIMVYLMYQNVDPKKAFFIMENVRKGKGLTQEEIDVLNENNIPKWYIESCQKIKYMFPKAHAAAYVLMALRIAYYKVYYPLEYYCAYFSSRVSDFDPLSMIKGKEKLKKRLSVLEEFDDGMSDIKKKSLTNSLKMSLEMTERGFSFLKFDLDTSQAFEFTIDYENNGLILPFGVIEGLGEKEAINIVEQREIAPFKTKEDLKKRTKVKAKTLEQLEYFNVLDGLEESNQTKLF